MALELEIHDSPDRIRITTLCGDVANPELNDCMSEIIGEEDFIQFINRYDIDHRGAIPVGFWSDIERFVDPFSNIVEARHTIIEGVEAKRGSIRVVVSGHTVEMNVPCASHIANAISSYIGARVVDVVNELESMKLQFGCNNIDLWHFGIRYAASVLKRMSVIAVFEVPVWVSIWPQTIARVELNHNLISRCLVLAELHKNVHITIREDEAKRVSVEAFRAKTPYYTFSQVRVFDVDGLQARSGYLFMFTSDTKSVMDEILFTLL